MTEQYQETFQMFDSPASDGKPSMTELDCRDQLRGTKILIVEDFELNRNLFKTFLLHFVAEIDTAENGLQALELVELNHSQNAAHPYDAIIMDIRMPVMDGFEAALRLRAIKEHSKIPIIGLSAAMMDNETKDYLKYGMNDFVRKPVDVDELLTVLAKWVARRDDY